MRILLTGSSGFVGSHLLATLISQKIPVAILLRKDSDLKRIQTYLDCIPVFKVNSLNLNAVSAAVKHFEPDTLINLAWYGVGNSYKDDTQQISQNLLWVQAVFNLVRDVGITSIIGLGSQAEYGPQNGILDETTLPQPTTLYGVAKLAAYHTFRTLCLQHHIRFVWLRLFSAYGPADNPSWFIPYVIQSILKKNEPRLTKGEQKWDYIYISDVVRAIMGIFLEPKAAGVFNLGSGQIFTLKEIAEVIRNQLDPKVQLNFGTLPYRPDQTMHLQANISRLKNSIPWEPEISLIQGIKKTIAWFREHHVCAIH